MEIEPTSSTKPVATDPAASNGASDSTASGTGSTLDAAKQQTREVLDQAKEQAGEVVEQTKQKAGQLADQTRSRIRTQLETQKEKATGGLGVVAQALHQTGQHLQGQSEAAAVGDYADAIAEQVERLSGYLRQRSMDDLVSDVQDLARRQTALFLGGAFVLGLLTARFLKSSQRGGGETGGETRALVPVDSGSMSLAAPITPPPHTAHNYVPGGVAGTGNPPQER